LSVFYAGALWALEGCRDLGVGSDASHHADHAVSGQHHDAGTAPHHSHSDPAKVHCPNILGEFVLSSPVSLYTYGNVAFHADYASLQFDNSFLGVTLSNIGLAPPSPNLSPTFPRHLLVSVLQI
jgi:hypothetical protein